MFMIQIFDVDDLNFGVDLLFSVKFGLIGCFKCQVLIGGLFKFEVEFILNFDIMEIC